MPTSSQAMIVLTDEGTDPRIPRRHFTSYNSNVSLMNIGNHNTFSETRLPEIQSSKNTSGFQNIVDVKGYRGTISYDAATKNLRWVISTQQDQTAPSSRAAEITHPAVAVHANSSEGQAMRQSQLENLGVRRRILNGQVTNKLITSSTSSLPTGAKFLPSPPGQKPRALLPDVIPAKTDTYGDVPTISASNERPVPNIKPKSFIEELKESISYDKRLFPSMHMRSSIPPSCPNSVCFSLRCNDEYSHKDILDLLKRTAGLTPSTIMHDPVDVRAGNSEVPSRWVVDFRTAEDAHSFLHNGLEINGEKIIVKFLDDVHKLEYKAYLLKLEEDRKLAERKSKCSVSKKSRRASHKHNGRSKKSH